MAQRDYVSRGRTGTRGKRNCTRKKKKSASGAASKLMIVLAIAILAVFAGGLYYITQNKPPQEPQTPNSAANQGNALPPKPTDRWSYIKELENRQVTNSPNSGSTQPSLSQQTQLTAEQRKALEQIQSDMQKTLTTPSRADAMANNPAISRDGGSRPALNSTTSNSPKPTTPPAATVQSTSQARQQRWTIQCGSFRAAEQADSVKVKLAFAGFESRINSSGGWSRVILGPYSNRDGADRTLQRLKSAGMGNCIPVSAGN